MQHPGSFRVLVSRTFLLTSCLAATAAHAVESLDPIVVTATRTAQTVDETLSSVTVIEREEIERLQPQQFTDLLRGRAGLGVADNGPFGKTSGVFMRGTNSNHTLLLVDGVRMGSATTGAPAWQYLLPSEIERIEIVRGPRSSIYGSDALGGVIQIFTREGREGPPRVNAFVGGGSFNTRELGAGVAGGTAASRYSLSASYFDTDGIDALTGVGDDDPDGYDNTSVSGKVRHWLDNGVEIFASLLYSEGRTEFDSDEFDPVTFAVLGPYSPAYSDYLQSAVRAGLRTSLSPNWDAQLALSQSRDELSSFEGGTLTDRESRFDTRRDMVDWQNTIRLNGGWLLLAGIDAYEDRVRSSEAFAEDSRYNMGAYSILEGQIGVHDLAASLRYDENQQFGGKTTGQLGWGLPVSETTRVRASVGTAFKAPSFNELYFPDSAFFRGNPDLNPEESRTLELGGRYASGPAFVDVAVFHTRIDDLITSLPDEQWTFVPTNIDRARIQGVEVETGYQTSVWTTRASLTLLDTEDRATGNELRRRPPASARLDLDRRFGDLSLGGSLIGQGRSYEDADNTDRLSGFATVDLRASYAIDREWTVAASVQNLFDRDYVVSRQFGTDYNQPGRGLFVTLRYQQR
jgi:vitamin B12 transporter